MLNLNSDELRNDWQEVPLGEVMTLQRGFDLPRNKRLEGPFPVIASTGRVGSHTEAKVRGPGVVIGRSGSLGGGQYIKDDFWPLNTTLWVKDFKGNDRHFCYYLLKSLDLAHFNAGSGVPTLNRNHIHPLPVLCPPFPEQRAIAHILGTLDDKIELNRRMNETLEEMARALFKSWFVDFEPVRAKMEGRWRRGQSLPGMPAKLYDLFPDGMVDSELGEIPAGWEVGVLDDVIELRSGGTPKTTVAEYWDGEIPWYTAKDAPTLSDVFVLDTERKITMEGVENSATKILPTGTTVITARGTVGKIACLGIPMSMNQTCYGIRGASGYPDFFTYLNIRLTVDELRQRTHGTIFDTITRQTFKLIGLAIPPARIANAFEKRVDPIMSRILSNLHDSLPLAALRDTLLPKLVSGKLQAAQRRNRQHD